MVSVVCEYECFVVCNLYGWFSCIYVCIRVAFIEMYLD
jgi:hypothetical protein